ncbi:hypothetical protein HY441_01690 [Candidatus Microgenomates bacterium]|nr:hypothetical protein [Candidatus Microgenomates bacterium]
MLAFGKCSVYTIDSYQYHLSLETNMQRGRSKHSQDFIISTSPTWLRWARPLLWLGLRLKGRKYQASYYRTTIRRVGKSKIEVNFDLPPNIKQQMHKAIEAGKQIRLFVL